LIVDTLGPTASGEYLSGETGWLLMQRPKVDDDLILLTDFGKAEAIVVEVVNNPATEEGGFTQGNDARPLRTKPAGLDRRS